MTTNLTYSPDQFTAAYLAFGDGPALIGAVTALMALATVSVVLRFWIRLHRRIGLRLDDWLIGASMVLMCGLIVCSISAVRLGGVGEHFEVNWMEDPGRPKRSLQILYAAQPILLTNITLVKFSILAMYYRSFPTRFMKWGCIILATVTALWSVSTLLSCLFQCTPIKKSWELGVEGTCVNTLALYIGTTGVPNLATDFSLLCLPMYEVYKLHTPTSQKIALAASFLLGAMVIVADIFKLQVLVDLYMLDRAGSLHWDFLDNIAILMIWVITEHALSIICANIPSLRPILTMFLRWTGLNSRIDPKVPPPPKKGIVTIGGSGENNNSKNSSSKRHKSGKSDWTALMQDSMPGTEENQTTIRAPTPPGRHHSSSEKLNQTGSDSGTEEVDGGKTTVGVNTSDEFEMQSVDACTPGWPSPAAYRVTTNSQQRPSGSSQAAEVGRTWSTRGFHGRPKIDHGGSPAGSEMPAIAVTTDTEVAWKSGS